MTESRSCVENRKILRDRAAGGPIEVFDLVDASPSMRVRPDLAGVDREGMASDDFFFHAAPKWERRRYSLPSSRKTSACDAGISGDERYGGE